MHETSCNLRIVIALSLITLFGFALRVYNIDFPSIGYHAMRENESLSLAQEMRRTGDFMTKRVYFYNAFENDPGLKKTAEIPWVAYQIIGAWRLWGENLWGPRLVNVFFGLLGIIVIYFIARLLLVERYNALLCALLLAVMPLVVFFSRNLQPECPALFFMLAGSLCYLKFISSAPKKQYLFLGAILFSIAGLYQYNFLIGLLPLLGCAPYKIIDSKKRLSLKYLLACLSPYALVFLSVGWVATDQGLSLYVPTLGKFFQVFLPDYWSKYGGVLLRYAVSENFTLIYALLAVLGVFIAIFTRPKQLVERYIIGWVIALLPYSMIFAQPLSQQNYYQMPFALLVCLAIGYAIARVKKMTGKSIFIIFISVITLTAGLQVSAALRSMQATVFLGLDVAGESLKRLTIPDERIFLYSHAQGNGIARYAWRYMGWADTAEDFKDKEQRFGVRYVCFYPAEFAHALKAKQPELFSYIKDNYHWVEAGITVEPYQIFYLILEKGKGSSEKDFLQEFSGAMQLRTIYKMFGRFVFFYTMHK